MVRRASALTWHAATLRAVLAAVREGQWRTHCRPCSPVALGGELAFFRVVRVLELSDAGRDAVLDALANDPVASARLRLG